MSWYQKEIRLDARPRGCHLVTREIEARCPELKRLGLGLAHLFVKHTSASLTINENADKDVRHDLEAHLNVLAPENAPHYRHTCEGPDDMPAHIKSSLMGSSLTIPITDGRFNLGTWQGIYLNEHRDHGSPRRIVITLQGQ